MRLVWLQIKERTADSVVVSAPLSSTLAPAGYYMIHVLNSAGVPSVAKIIQIPGVGSGSASDTTPPAQVAGLTITPASNSQLNLNWNANTELDINHYNVYRSTIPSFSVNLLSDAPIAQPTSNSYSDTGLASATSYYYKVAAVDNANNIGPLSTEVSARTGEIFYNVPSPGGTPAKLYNNSSAVSTRYGEEARIASSAIVGKSLKALTVYLRRLGSPFGKVNAVVRSALDDTIVADLGSIDSVNLPTIFAPISFYLPGSPYIIKTGDKILIEYNGPYGIEIDTWAVDKFDASATRRIRYNISGGYVGGNTQDIVGTMSTA
jgi:hypothetical protein